VPGDSLKFSVNISPVTYPQHNNLTAFKIEDNSIISDSESISSKLRVSKCFSIKGDVGSKTIYDLINLIG